MMQEKPSRQNKVLVYTFFSYTKKMSKLLFDAQLDYADKYFINSKLPDKKFLEKIRNYELVVGIADNKKNAKVNRLEAVYKNLYGKHKINEDGLGNYCPNIIFNEEELDEAQVLLRTFEKSLESVILGFDQIVGKKKRREYITLIKEEV